MIPVKKPILRRTFERGTRAVVSALVLVAAPAALAAQQRDTTSADSARAYRLRPVVVTVGRTPIAAERSGFSVTVLSHDKLALLRPFHAADALRGVAGAHVDEAVGAGGPAIIRLRGGEEVFTQILLDGVQVNQNGGFFDFQGLTLGNLDQIEVVRGPQSAIWGSSAMTGVVNFITRPGEVGPPQFDLTLERGVATVRSNSYSGGGSVRGGSQLFRYSASAGTSFMRGIHSVPHDIKTNEAALRFDLSPLRTVDLMAVARGVDLDANLPVRDPGATRVPLDPNARNERERVIGLLQATHRISSSWSQRLKLSGFREDFLFSDQRDGLNTDSLGVFVFDASFAFDAKLRRTTGEYSWHIAPAGAAGIEITAGAQLEREKLTEIISGDFQDAAERERDSRSGFMEVRARPINALDLSLSSRVEKYDGLDLEHTPRFSLAYAVSPGFRLRASAARGFKAPNLREQYLDNPFIASNPDLRAESSTNVEVGAEWTGRSYSFSSTVFRQQFRNLIRTVALEGTDKQINRNLGRSIGSGIEWEAALQVRPNLELSSAGAVIKTEVKDNRGLSADQYPVGESMPFRPDYNVSVAAEWRPIDKFTALLRTSVVGEQTVLTERFSGERRDLGSYALVGVNLNYAYRPESRVYLRVDNLLNHEYATAFDQRGMPLTAALGVQLQLASSRTR